MKDYCMENLETLAKRYGKTKRQLEEAAGLSVGYLSRCKTEGTMPKWKALVAIAEELNVSVDLLCRYRISKLSPDDIEAYKFMETLSLKTVNRGICWRKYPGEIPNLDAEPDGGNHYYADLGNGCRVFLASVKTTPLPSSHDASNNGEVELHMLKNSKYAFVCSSNLLTTKLADKLRGLYDMASEHGPGKHLFWDEKTRSMITETRFLLEELSGDE